MNPIVDLLTDRRTPDEIRKDRIIDIVGTTVSVAIFLAIVALAFIGFITVISWLK